MASIIPFLPSNVKKFVGVDNDPLSKTNRLCLEFEQSLSRTKFLCNDYKTILQKKQNQIEPKETVKNSNDFNDFELFDNESPTQNDFSPHLIAENSNFKNAKMEFKNSLSHCGNILQKLRKNSFKNQKDKKLKEQIEDWDETIKSISSVLEAEEEIFKCSDNSFEIDKKENSPTENIRRINEESDELDFAIDGSLKMPDGSSVIEYLNDFFQVESSAKINGLNDLKNNENNEIETKKINRKSVQKTKETKINLNKGNSPKQSYKKVIKKERKSELKDDLNRLVSNLKETALAFNLTLESDKNKLDHMNSLVNRSESQARTINKNLTLQTNANAFVGISLPYFFLFVIFIFTYAVIKTFPSTKPINMY